MIIYKKLSRRIGSVLVLIFLKSINLIFYRLKNKPLSKPPLLFLSQYIFDLNRIKKIQQGSYNLHRSNFSDPTEYIVSDGHGLFYSSYFKYPNVNLLYSSRKNKILRYEEPCILLSYYSTHFGHFVGDCIGIFLTIINYKYFSNRKVVFIGPDTIKKFMIDYFGESKFIFIDSSIKSNLQFSDAILIPKISQYQNLILAENQLFQCITPVVNEKVFFTSNRASRIANISEVISFFQKKGFFVMCATENSFEFELSVLIGAETLFIENGSLLLNSLIIRKSPTYVFTGKKSEFLNEQEYAGGGIYNSFKWNILEYIYCNEIPSNKHPYSNQIYIDLLKLESLINNI
jgi:hypothetical protein